MVFDGGNGGGSGGGSGCGENKNEQVNPFLLKMKFKQLCTQVQKRVTVECTKRKIKEA